MPQGCADHLRDPHGEVVGAAQHALPARLPLRLAGPPPDRQDHRLRHLGCLQLHGGNGEARPWHVGLPHDVGRDSPGAVPHLGERGPQPGDPPRHHRGAPKCAGIGPGWQRRVEDVARRREERPDAGVDALQDPAGLGLRLGAWRVQKGHLGGHWRRGLLSDAPHVPAPHVLGGRDVDLLGVRGHGLRFGGGWPLDGRLQDRDVRP
mmetsp:Transcript_34041/g.98120  ORF Transcript_34041/g.98120 Transcript_34041/m.98120 type:complete len:206 (+) Transcript_34041:501-1118(+)